MQNRGKPTIASLTPATALPGAQITVNGQKFSTESRVQFAGANVPISILDAQHIRATVPAGTGTAAVTATSAYGTSNAVSFTYQAVPTPTPVVVTTSLQAAIDGAAAGSTLTIPTGTYQPVIISKPLTLIALPGCIIQGGEKTVQIKSTAVYLRGPAVVKGASNSGICAMGAYSDIGIYGWLPQDCGDFGVVIQGAAKVTIEDVIGHGFRGANYPPHVIYLRDCGVAAVRRCEGYGLGYKANGVSGLQLANVANAVVEDCYMHDCKVSASDGFGFIAADATNVSYIRCRGGGNVADFYDCYLSGRASYDAQSATGSRKVYP